MMMMTRPLLLTGLAALGIALTMAPVRAVTTGIAAIGLSGGQNPPGQNPPPPTTPQSSQGQISVSLNNPGSHPLLAIPAFTGAGADAELLAAAKAVADVLWNDLDFEQEFEMVSKEAAARIPIAESPETLPYDRWQEVGANYVVLGNVHRDAKGLSVDIRLIGVRGDERGKQKFGYGYNGCTLTNARACAHAISDDMHQKIRGVDGVAQSHMAFTSDRDALRMTGRTAAGADQSKEIYFSDYDGANQYRVTVNQSLNLHPAWAPDGQTLAYTSYSSGYPDVYVLNIFQARAPMRPAAGDEKRQNELPAWSPDGTKIAFASSREGGLDIFVMNRDGSNLHNITNSRRESVANMSPTWSPSGTQIAFTSDRGGSNQIYIVSADGTGLERLTSDASPTDRPTWSPAPFNTIAYAAGPGPGHDIWLIDVTTRKTIQLTDGIGNNESPSFAPNGRHVAFRTSRYGKDQIAIVGVNGKIQRQVTQTGNNTSPSWSRIPR
jgi:TolB protein